MIVTFEAMIRDMREDLTKVYRETLPFASVVALTRTAIAARDGVRLEMPRVFDRPTPFAIRGVQAVPANKATMTSAVTLNAARNYIVPEVDAGERGSKASENALRLAGVMPSADYEVPSRQAVLDQYGNLPRATIMKVLSSLKAKPLASPAVRRSHKRGGFKSRQTGTPYFVAKSKQTGQPLGIWQIVSSGHVAPVLIFTDRDPAYRERLPFDDIVKRIAEATFPVELEKALLEFAAR